MKILMINSVCGVLSTGRICAELAEELEKQGNEVKIAYGRGSVPEKYRRFAVKIGGGAGVKLHALKARAFDAMGFGSASATKKFIEWVKSYDPDIIHLHNIHGYYINVRILFEYLKTCRKQIIWTMHDCWPFTGHCAYFDSAGCEKWKSGCFDCPQKGAYPQSFFDKSKSNHQIKKELFTGVTDLKIVTPSSWLKGLIKESFLRDYPISVIRNGIDTDTFTPKECSFREARKIGDKLVVLGVAAQWDKRKGLDDFISLSGMLGENAVIVLVGLDENAVPDLPDNIIPFGLTSDVNELVGLYSCADYFVNPTHEDNYPTVNIESICCGTPVITYDTGGSPESVRGHGAVVERGNVKALKEAIEETDRNVSLSDEDRRFYDKRTTIGNYIELYEAKAEQHR